MNKVFNQQKSTTSEEMLLQGQAKLLRYGSLTSHTFISVRLRAASRCHRKHGRGRRSCTRVAASAVAIDAEELQTQMPRRNPWQAYKAWWDIAGEVRGRPETFHMPSAYFDIMPVISNRQKTDHYC